MSGYDDLLRQLRASVRELGAEHSETARPEHRRRRSRGRRRGLLAALAALLVGGGVAGAAQVGVLPGAHHGDRQRSARQVAYDAVTAARGSAACRTLESDRGATVVTAELPAVAATLIAGPPDPAAQAQAAKLNHGGPLVAGSARRLAFAGGSYALVWTTVGSGFGSLADPAACADARLAALHADISDVGSRLRAKAEVVLRGMRDVIPGLQMLNIALVRPGARSTGGTGIPLDGRPLRPGILFHGSGDYVGLAAPDAVRVTVDGRRLHRSAEVRGRLFALRLPGRTGPLVVRQRGVGGRVLAREALRK